MVVIPLQVVPDPLAVLDRFRHARHAALLHSANPGHVTGRYSFFSADPVDVIHAGADDWPATRERLRTTLTHRFDDDGLPPFRGGWIGWFAYELGRAFDTMQCAATDDLRVPDVALALYDWTIAWDHLVGRAWILSSGIDRDGRADRARSARRAQEVSEAIGHDRGIPDASPTGARVAMRDFTPARYVEAVAAAVEHVLAGDIFQVNLSQRFVVPFAGDAVSLFTEIARRTSAPMAAFLQHDAHCVASASPERFIRHDARTRTVESRPIKGTRPRGATAAADALLAGELTASEKDRAENVMIVDLVRNDLARVCEPGSVEVPALCALETHPTVHHLVSTVVGELRSGCDALDLLEATFPGGSVTGAPKLRAMQIIAELEPVRRGVYCGAIGWLGLDGSMDTSIAIRTITIAGNRASLHAGGGITALSDPAAEHDETIDKARALLESLGAAP